MPDTQFNREESLHTVYIDIKANDHFTPDFSKFLRDVENNAVSFERKQTLLLNRLASKWKETLFSDPSRIVNILDLDPGIYDFWRRYLDLMIDDIEIKSEELAKVIEAGLNKPYIPRTKLKAVEDLAKYEKQIIAEKEKLTKDYYQSVSFEDESYYTYRLKLINQDAELFEKKLGDKFNVAKYVNAEMLKLGNEYEKFLSDKAKSQASAPLKENNWPITRCDYNLPKTLSDSNYPLTDSWLVNPMSIDFTPLKTVKVPETPPINLEHQSELIKDIIKNSVVASIGFENLSKALAQSLSLIRINLSENASEMEKIWGGMINSMIEDVASLISKWLVLNTISGLFGLGTGFGAVTFESLLGIPKLAGGGDFIVPPGFPNDSYPILVQSGERVRVTPTSSTAPDTKLLSEIRDALYALNLNSTSGTRQNPVILKLFLDGRELAKSTTYATAQFSREGKTTE